VLHVEISKALKRKFDLSSGKEIEPNYGKDKKVSTGYLMSSYSELAHHFFSSQLRLICLEICLNTPSPSPTQSQDVLMYPK